MAVGFSSFIGAALSGIYMFAADDSMRVKVTVTGRGGTYSLMWGCSLSGDLLFLTYYTKQILSEIRKNRGWHMEKSALDLPDWEPKTFCHILKPLCSFQLYCK
jgi:hypothetical protein